MTSLDGKSTRRVGLSEQRPLSDQEIERARDICAQIEALGARRSAIVQERGLDPKFALPAANWVERPDSPFYLAYQRVLQGDYRTLNHLRFFTFNFSGYRLLSFELAEGAPAVTEIPEDYDAQLPVLLPDPETDAWVDRWQALTCLMPDAMIARPPKRLGEVGWEVDDVIVNYDACVYQERLNLMFEAGIIDLLQSRARRGRPIRILEIGGGYGAVAYFMKQILGEATYTICDLPDSLLFSALYLGLTRPDALHRIYDGADLSMLQADAPGFCFVPNYLFDDLLASGRTFDLVINTLSMSEMSEAQVRVYGAGIQQLIGADGVFFEQNRDNRHAGLNYCKEHLRDYFAHRTPLDGRMAAGSTQGDADIWSNRSLTELLSEIPETEKRDDQLALIDAYLNEIEKPAILRQVRVDRVIDRMLYAIDPNRKDVVFRIASFGEFLGRNGAAIASLRLFEEITKAFPNEGALHNLYGEALFQTGCIQQARTAFLRASQLAPEEAEIQNNLAVVFWQMGDPVEAFARIAYAVKLDPNYSEAAANFAAMQAALSETA